MSEVQIDDVATLEIVAAIGQRPEAPATPITPADRLQALAAGAWDRGAGLLRAVRAWKDLSAGDRRSLAGTLQRTAKNATEAADQARARLRTIRTEVEMSADALVQGYRGSAEGFEARKLRRRMVLDRLLGLDQQRRVEVIYSAISAVDEEILEAALLAGPLDRRQLGVEGDVRSRAEETLLRFRDPAKAERVAAGRQLAEELELRLGSLDRLARRAAQHAEDAVSEAAEDPRHRARQALEDAAD